MTTSFVTGAIYVFACSTWWVNHEWKGATFETSENHVKDVYSQQADFLNFSPFSSGKMATLFFFYNFIMPQEKFLAKQILNFMHGIIKK